MMPRHLRIVVLGLSLSSSWGNGHATTYRALLRGLAARGHDVLFLERETPWYAQHRDLPEPDFCRFSLYDSLADLDEDFTAEIAHADAVIVGSYVPDGVAIIERVLATARGIRAFYDIDTPVTLASLTAGAAEYIDPAQIARWDIYLSFTGGPILERLANAFGARRPRAFYCSVDQTQYCPQTVAMRWDLGYLGTYSPDRQPALERLLIEPARRLPNRRFVVAGPQYPPGIAWPANIERIEHLPPAAHAEFYSRQRFTLNVTRADMVQAGWSPSVRLFEAAACGTAIISDRWPGLTELLPEREAILIAEDSTAVTALLEDAGFDRAGISRRARRLVLARHTGLARAVELEALLAEAEADRASHTGGRAAAARLKAAIKHLGPPPPAAGRRSRLRCWRLVSWDEAEGACPTRWLAGVVRMIDAIRDRHLREIEWAYPVQASHVHAILALVRSPLMMRVYSAARTEEVLRRSGMEAVAG